MQPIEDPFGDSPFKATPQDNIPAQPSQVPTVTSLPHSGAMGGSEPPLSAAGKFETFPSFGFGDAFGDLTYSPSPVNGEHTSANSSFSTTEFPEHSNNDILDSILPRNG